MALVNKVDSRLKLLSTDPPSGHVNSDSNEQQQSPDNDNDVNNEDDDEVAVNEIFQPSQQVPSQSQVWPIEDEEVDASPSLPITVSAPPPPLEQSSDTTMRISAIDRYFSPAFKQPESYLKLNQILRVLMSIQASIIEGVLLQYRRVYYEDKDLFKTQECVNNIVRCLEDYWEVPSSSFNMLPAHKGLYAGPIGYTTRQSYLEARRERNHNCDDPDLASNWGVTWSNKDRDKFVYRAETIEDTSQLQCLNIITKISWVLVVEKETVFSERVQELNRAVQEETLESSIGHGIILTAKGMPDFATRRMLEMMADTLDDSVPFFALMDGDAYGMHIYHTYCSSIRHHQGMPQQMADRLIWVGLKPSDSLPILQRYAATTPNKSQEGSGAVQIDLHEHDRAQHLAKHGQAKGEVQLEALRLIQYGYKLELEAIVQRSLVSILQPCVDRHRAGRMG